MTASLPIKKRLSLHCQGESIRLDVAQDLFSSHQIDRGSRMLLASLEGMELPERGAAVDYGCGYGVLGIAWQAVYPGWQMCYVDRDRLAVAFAEHNVHLSIPHLADRSSYVHDVTPPEPPAGGHDLVLWNVPGKAGEEVLQSLTEIILDGLGMNGLLALVVVNPLAPALRQAADRSDVSCDLDESGREHTVLHLRKLSDVVAYRDAFAEGIFDRPPALFSLGKHTWELQPVTGLPEYDSLNHATVLAGEAMIVMDLHRTPDRWLVHEPGVGHLAVLASMVWPEAAGVISSRDALALKASTRTLAQARRGGPPELRPVWGFPQTAEVGTSIDIAVVAVPDQVQAEELEEHVFTLEACVVEGGVAILHGGSTEIGRLERLVNRSRRWRASKRQKNRGSACVRIDKRC